MPSETVQLSEWRAIGSLPLGDYEVVADGCALVIRQMHADDEHAADGWAEVAVRAVTRRGR